MSTKNSRDGGKFAGSHTTVTPMGAVVADLVAAQPEVTKISLGVIKTGLPSANGNRRVKIIRDATCVRLHIRDNATIQEIIVYTTDKQQTMLSVAKGAREKGLRIAFKKDS